MSSESIDVFVNEHIDKAGFHELLGSWADSEPTVQHCGLNYRLRSRLASDKPFGRFRYGLHIFCNANDFRILETVAMYLLARLRGDRVSAVIMYESGETFAYLREDTIYINSLFSKRLTMAYSGIDIVEVRKLPTEGEDVVLDEYLKPLR